VYNLGVTSAVAQPETAVFEPSLIDEALVSGVGASFDLEAVLAALPETAIAATDASPVPHEVMPPDIAPISEDELGASFDELMAMAISQPDETVARNGLRELLSIAKEQGSIGLAMRMGAAIMAAACTHPHLESLASEVAEGLQKEPDDKAPHKHMEDHDEAACDDCQAGRPCSKKGDSAKSRYALAA